MELPTRISRMKDKDVVGMFKPDDFVEPENIVPDRTKKEWIEDDTWKDWMEEKLTPEEEKAKTEREELIDK